MSASSMITNDPPCTPSQSPALLGILSLALLVPAPALAAQKAPEAGDARPGPELKVLTAGEHAGGSLPLKRIAAHARVSGALVDVSVEHTFENPYEVPLEVIYTFPLPDQAAVDRMEIVIGERVIQGVVKTREQARKDYEKAKNEGKTAALLDQERANVFTQTVANVVPGEAIVVRVGYRDVVPFEDGRYELVVPATVGPKFSPANVTDVAKVTPPLMQSTQETGTPFDIRVTIDGGLEVSDVRSSTHAVVVDEVGDTATGTTVIKLDAGAIPNQDYVLTYRLGGSKPAAGFAAHRARSDGDGYLMLQLQPQLEVRDEDISPRELVFVVDNSGSMSGMPMQAAKALVHRALDHLRPGDTFQILRFSENASGMADRALPYSKHNVARGRSYIDSMAGMGGTMMIEGIKAALDPAVEPGRVRIVLFLTDGYIGNDQQIIGEVKSRTSDDTRLFSLGVGSSPNRFLLERMARVGRGAVAYVGYGQDPEKLVKQFYGRIDKPVLTHIEIDWGDLEVRDVTPLPIRDLFSDQPLTVFGRFVESGADDVIVRGRVGKRKVAIPVDVTLPEENKEHGVVAAMWARRQIADLEIAGRYGGDADAKKKVVALALEHQLMTKYTSFIAVDTISRVDPDGRRVAVHQPSELAAGVNPGMVGGVGTSLTRTAIPPGDPVLTVDAPRDAQRVVAHFPFGLTQALRWDARQQKWAVRFLVPKGFEDGVYTIRIAVTEADGTRRWLDRPYRLDGEGPELTVYAQAGVQGLGALIKVVGNEELKQVTVRAPWGEVVLVPGDGFGDELPEVYVDDEHETAPTEVLVGWLPIPADVDLGEHELVIIGLDAAGNTGRGSGRVEVVR